MKLEVNLGDELKHAKVSIPKIVPVIKNFDPTKIIGEAEVKQEGNNLVADIKIVNQKELEKIKRTLEVGVCGEVTSRDDNLIAGFNLRAASIQFKENLKFNQK